MQRTAARRTCRRWRNTSSVGDMLDKPEWPSLEARREQSSLAFFYRLSVWESQWDMEFNPSKCQVVRVTTAKEVINTVYTLHGQILEVVTSARYLGVDISSGLTWNSHIDRITGNANRTLGYIRRNIKTKNQKMRETAYNTLVHPQLEYSAPVWDPSSKDKRLQLEKIQRRAARWTTSNYDTRSSVTAMLNQLGWRTLEQRRADARLCLFYKIVYGLVAVPLPNYIQPTHTTCILQLHLIGCA